jgi:hypothetical protein
MVFDDGSSFQRVNPNVRNPQEARNREQISDASNVIPVRTLALVSNAAEARLGSTINDFRSAWGNPIREEVLDHTATLLWRPAEQGNEAFPPSIFEAEVSFLDQIACQIVLRSNQPLKKAVLVKLGKELVPEFRTSDLSRLKSESDGGRTYTLSSGGYITAWAREKPAVMVIRSTLFLRNNELFDREAAKVRPPTSNH